MKDLLRLNLQFFSDEDQPTDEPTGAAAPEDEPKGTDEPASKVFTQDEVNAIVAERLARFKKKQEDEAEQSRLEEQGEYKQLLEKANATIAELKEKEALAARKQAIAEKLVEKGVKHEDVPRYAKYVDKLVETDEDIEPAVNSVYEDFNAGHSYADPSAGFGGAKQREQKSPTEYGAELFKRLGR